MKNINNLIENALMPIDDFDRKFLLGENKPKISAFKKIRRELSRIYYQDSLLSKISPLIRYNLEKSNPTYKNKIKKALEKKYPHQVVLVFYQIKGVSASWKEVVRQLSEMDLGVCIVANGGLTPEDESLLSAYENVSIISRVNYGLDFGAYQVAVLNILYENKDIQKLTLVNDSFFFPLFGQVRDLFKKIDSKSESFIGLVENTNRDKLNDFHYGSFFIQFRTDILTSEAFFQFWKSFKVSNSKKNTIERGEKGLSQLIRKEGFSHDVVFNYQSLLEEIKQLTPIELLAAIDDVVLCYLPEWRIIQQQYREYLKESFEDSEKWKSDAIEWIDHVVEPFNKTHSGAILYPKLLGMPLLKRDLRNYYNKAVWEKIHTALSPVSEITLE